MDASFEPNNDGFGNRTKALDNILYRSWFEATFVNKWLYNKEEYIYELKYPDPYIFLYDFYLPKRDLYIEIDGELRPETILNKIRVNKKLKRNLLVLKTKEIKNFKGFNTI